LYYIFISDLLFYYSDALAANGNIFSNGRIFSSSTASSSTKLPSKLKIQYLEQINEEAYNYEKFSQSSTVLGKNAKFDHQFQFLLADPSGNSIFIHLEAQMKYLGSADSYFSFNNIADSRTFTAEDILVFLFAFASDQFQFYIDHGIVLQDSHLGNFLYSINQYSNTTSFAWSDFGKSISSKNSIVNNPNNNDSNKGTGQLIQFLNAIDCIEKRMTFLVETKEAKDETVRWVLNQWAALIAPYNIPNINDHNSNEQNKEIMETVLYGLRHTSNVLIEMLVIAKKNKPFELRVGTASVVLVNNMQSRIAAVEEENKRQDVQLSAQREEFTAKLSAQREEFTAQREEFTAQREEFTAKLDELRHQLEVLLSRKI
jgi:hypothetical protein